MLPDRATIDSLPVAAFVTDADGRIVRHNAAAAALWGRTPAPEARFTGALALLDAEGRRLAPEAAPAALALAGRSPATPATLLAERPDGSRAAYAAHPALLRAADGRVAGVLELMVETMVETAPDLAASRLAAIVSSSDDAIISKSLDGRVTSWNDAATRIFGWSAEEMLGDRVTRIIPPERLHEDEAILARIRQGQRVASYDTERLTRDGRRIAMSLTISPILDAAGRVVGASKIARDVSSRKRAEATQRQLVDELNHRVKNMLATIQAIAAQSLRRAASPEAFVQSFGGRVQALGRVHDLLAAGGMAGAGLGAILDAELAEARPPAGRVTAEGPPVIFDPRVAAQVALVLHELASNATRHGALAAPAGRVAVDWQVAAGPDGPRLRLAWREAGSVPPAPAEAAPGTGFGFTLIERSLVANGGSVVRRAVEDGLAWEIELPLPAPEATLPEGPADPGATRPAAVPAAALVGRRVLVVEDEPLVALEIEAELTDAGATVVGPAGSLEAAARFIEAGGIDVALLDANLAGQPVGALAAALDARGVPFGFASGYGPSGLPEGFRDRPLLGKPFGAEALIALVGGLLAGPAGATVVPLQKPD